MKQQGLLQLTARLQASPTQNNGWILASLDKCMTKV
jgi:hypothetical protein